MNFRPEYRAAWMQTPSFMQLPLVPLGEEAVRELLADLLGDDAERQRPRRHRAPARRRQPVLRRGDRADAGRDRERSKAPRAPTAWCGRSASSRCRRRCRRFWRRASTGCRSARSASCSKRRSSARRSRSACSRASAVSATPSFRTPFARCARREFLYEESLYPHVEYAFKHPLTQEVADRSQLEGAPRRDPCRGRARHRRAVGGPARRGGGADRASLGGGGRGSRGGALARARGTVDRPQELHRSVRPLAAGRRADRRRRGLE